MLLRFELAVEGDDAALRALFRRTPLPGPISLLFLREPSFFAAERIGNEESQVIVARDPSTGEILGSGCRSFRRLYVNGAETTVGYLSMLRGDPRARGGTGLARGYRFLRELHADGRAPFYITAIFDENRAARALLTSGRAGLPAYTPAGGVRTFLIPIRYRGGRRSPDVAPAGTEALSSLNAWNRRHQFAPVVRELTLPMYAFRGTLGTLAVWDQQSTRQLTVSSYAPALALVRPLYNAAARLRRHPPLPPPGETIRMLYGAFVSARDDDPAILAALVDHVRAEWSGRGHDFLAVGMAVDHPLAPVLVARAARTIDSTLYIVTWSAEERPALDGRRIHPEIATL